MAYRTKTPVKIMFRDFHEIEIPAGTRLADSRGDFYRVTAKPEWVVDEQAREMATRPGSLFRHDAKHFWAYVAAIHVEPFEP